MTLPAGYTWSPNITKPAPLVAGPKPDQVVNSRFILKNLQPGCYDVATVPWGDNWVSTTIGAIATVNLSKPSAISVIPRFPINESSSGFLILLRGPYAEGAEDHGYWQINTLPGGMNRGLASMPVYAHSGARYDRYGRNGYPWVGGEGGYPVPNLNGLVPAWGPKKFNVEARVPLSACATAPDVTILSSVPNEQVWIAYSIVDMLGRETPISDPVMVDKTPYDELGSYVDVSRMAAIPIGACGYRVYAGFSASDLHRQPVLNYSGSTDKWLWPLWLSQFVLHDVRTDTAVPEPSDTVQSILCDTQKQVLDGSNTIFQVEPAYDLYCPFVLPYDSSNFGREFTGKAKYNHKTIWEGQQLETDIPLMVVSNYGDRPKCMHFESTTAITGLATNDWANGGMAMSNYFERCNFYLSSPESAAFIVDERSAIANGAHTASEMTLKECGFSATIPVKLEGNQTGKIRFMDNCEFSGGVGQTRYPADTVGIVYMASPSEVHFDYVKGVNGNYRSLVCCCALSDTVKVYVTNHFVDAGCPVYVTFAGYPGGRVEFTNGEAINTPSNGPGWARLVEAPVARFATVKVSGVRINPYVSSVSFMLNQLSVISDQAVGEVVAPTNASWQSMGLALQYNGYDFTQKLPAVNSFGFSDVPNTNPSVSNIVTIAG